MAQGTLKINTDNILPIIKQWLYSDKDIFLRELVSNSCDAINKLKVLRDEKQTDFNDDELRVDIQIDKDAKTIKITDSGLGMNADEVENYIAQLAFSGAEEFLKKYNTDKESDQIIGHFGLGFYSAYMVSKNVTIDTLSYVDNSKPVFWSCDGSSEYTIDEGKRETRGTEITLFIDEENAEFLEENRLKEILMRYCAFLPYPIFLNGTQINAKEPLWLRNASDCTDKEYQEFFRSLYPAEPEPIFWVHLNVDYPFNLKGILYFPRVDRRFDWKQSSIKLFCNRVFVSDNCKDLIPEYLMILRGALDSPDIPLNVSRSYLQMDRTVRQLSTHIAKKIADRLNNLYTNEREKFIQYWPDLEIIIKLGAMQDDKFYDRIKEIIIWKNSLDEWTTTAEYIERHKENYKNKIYYTSQDSKDSHCLELYRDKGIEVLYANNYIDASLISFLEGKLQPAKFQRIDGAIDDAILDNSREKTVLDADGKTEGSKIASFFQSALDQEHLEVEAKSLTSDKLPSFLVIDEQQRRMREFLSMSNQGGAFPMKRTFVINTNNKLINNIYKLKEKQSELANSMIAHLYDLSLLSQKEFEPESLSNFVSRSSDVLEKLLSLHEEK